MFDKFLRMKFWQKDMRVILLMRHGRWAMRALLDNFQRERESWRKEEAMWAQFMEDWKEAQKEAQKEAESKRDSEVSS